MHAPDDLLVILEPHRAVEAAAQVQSVAAVTQMLAPRLVLVRNGKDTRERILSIPGVLGVYDRPPPDLPPDVTPAERLFVGGWAQAQHPKVRAHDGSSWNAPGLQPPD